VRVCDATKTSPSGDNFTKAEGAGNTSDVDVDHQLLGELPDGNSCRNATVQDVHLLAAAPDNSVDEK
jgi:hypothetical protein